MSPSPALVDAPSGRRSRFRSIGLLLGALALALVSVGTTACGPASDSTSSLTISAASSLQGAFTDLRTQFEASHPQVAVTINFGASSTLAQQIIAGAPVDVLASADEANMSKVRDANLLAGDPTVFATNTLEIIVGRGNPSKISTLADLTRPGTIYVTCAPNVPIGRYSEQIFAKAGLTSTPASLEPDVKGIVTKVISGEADAGIVYATDVAATEGAADGIEIPVDANVVAIYPIAPIAGSPNGGAAQAWIDFVMGPDGRSILEAHGFGAP